MKKVLATLGAAGLPFVAFAQNIQGILGTVSQILSLLIPILITLAVIYFFWGLIQYLRGDVSEKEKGRDIMIYGVIAIFVMVSVFGLVQLLGNTFGIRQGGGIITPTVPR